MALLRDQGLITRQTLVEGVRKLEAMYKSYLRAGKNVIGKRVIPDEVLQRYEVRLLEAAARLAQQDVRNIAFAREIANEVKEVLTKHSDRDYRDFRFPKKLGHSRKVMVI